MNFEASTCPIITYEIAPNSLSLIYNTECIATTHLLDDVVDDGLAPPPADPWQRVAARRLADERGRGALPHRRRPLPERLPRRPAHDARPVRRDCCEEKEYYRDLSMFRWAVLPFRRLTNLLICYRVAYYVSDMG